MTELLRRVLPRPTWYEIGEPCRCGARYPGDVCHCFDARRAEQERAKNRLLATLRAGTAQ